MKSSAICQENQPIIHTFLPVGSQNSTLGKQARELNSNPSHNWFQRTGTRFVHDTLPDCAHLAANYKQIKEHIPWHGMSAGSLDKNFYTGELIGDTFLPWHKGRRLGRWGGIVELDGGRGNESEKWRIRRSTTIFAIYIPSVDEKERWSGQSHIFQRVYVEQNIFQR